MKDRPKPPSGVDDVDHIYARIQELKKAREEAEQAREPFLEQGDMRSGTEFRFSDGVNPRICYTAYCLHPRWWRP